MIWYLFIIPILYLLFQWQGKVEFYKMKNGKEPLKAKVIEYRNEKSPMRNDYTQIPYPYVQTDSDNSKLTKLTKLTKLKYANSMSKPFKIGEDVDVFWYG